MMRLSGGNVGIAILTQLLVLLLAGFFAWGLLPLSWREYDASGLAVGGPASALYRPRQPEETVLYQAVAGNFLTFQALAELEGKRSPNTSLRNSNAFCAAGFWRTDFSGSAVRSVTGRSSSPSHAVQPAFGRFKGY